MKKVGLVIVVLLVIIGGVLAMKKVKIGNTSGIKCVVGGCSGQLCISEDQAKTGGITTCEFRAEYACYKSAKCEVQATGECGWTQTDELKKCLDDSTTIRFGQ